MNDVLPGDSEIRDKLAARTTEELLSFHKKLRCMSDNPQARAIRFWLIKELLCRYTLSPESFQDILDEDLRFFT
jgi:hypothetical protein